MKKKTTTPEELNGEALLAWDRFHGDDADETDRPAMILLCQAWGELVEAERQVAKTGTVIKLPNGYPGPTPFLKVRDNARATVIRLLREFGFTPQSRAKILSGKAQAEEPAELDF